MKWFFERYKRHKGLLLALAVATGSPYLLITANVLEVADQTHDEARKTLGKSPVPEPAPAPDLTEQPAQPEKSDDATGI